MNKSLFKYRPMFKQEFVLTPNGWMQIEWTFGITTRLFDQLMVSTRDAEEQMKALGVAIISADFALKARPPKDFKIDTQ